ncbi:tyrosine-type recombinase/integrase [Synoicihabitans lomoniglobus]|uniref:Tyrosine-type recombinase/integrase n=1 Tax=Synoicihabitans lomoniglobus TaxID=2909285 RepID=A0AAF0I3A4_9BACT|nr:tyrosine-type recombinase/integrase [Opitutaceae bacterium LMO-M01]WED66014.1 tyrosine-type recombinase/integrase [Opitutaceae bacterium LMO-M01]
MDTANQAAAAVKARDIYLSLISVGWEATLERYKPGAEKQDRGCTVGEFLADVGKRSHLKPATLRRYAVKLRKMVSDIAKLEVGLKAKARRAKYDYVNGGRAAWLAKIDGQPLDVLTPDSVNAWRNAYVARAGSDPTRRKSAERSAASYLRCTRALFTPDVLNLLKVNFPANPYEGMKLKDPGPQRYHSDVNAEWLLACAQRELWPTNRQEFLGLVLALWAGLRRKEADLLLWEQVDLAEGCIHLRRSKWFEPKTEESQRTIDLAATAVEVLKEFKNGCVSEFVMEGAQPNPAASYDYYRCDCTWRRLNAWLKEKGVKQAKAIHGLRKESGSLVAADFGIEAARQHLGHRDIRVTSAHYVAKRKRVEVSIGGARLRPLEVADES